MAICKNCDNEIPEGTTTCPHCGASQLQTAGILGIVLGLISPIVGVIAGCIYNSKGNKTAARNSFIAAAASFVIGFVLILVSQ